MENDLVKVLDTNEMLDKELTRILDIKEETDKHLIEAYKKIAELETHKNQISLLSVFILTYIKHYLIFCN